jgi:RHS repeat-associated protein
MIKRFQLLLCSVTTLVLLWLATITNSSFAQCDDGPPYISPILFCNGTITGVKVGWGVHQHADGIPVNYTWIKNGYPVESNTITVYEQSYVEIIGNFTVAPGDVINFGATWGRSPYMCENQSAYQPYTVPYDQPPTHFIDGWGQACNGLTKWYFEVPANSEITLYVKHPGSESTLIVGYGHTGDVFTSGYFPESTFTLKVSVNGCELPTKVIGAGDVTPKFNVTPSSPTVCPGEKVKLTASAMIGHTTFTWKNASGVVLDTDETYDASPGDVYLYGTSSEGCTASNPKKVTVAIPELKPPFVEGANQTVCAGNIIIRAYNYPSFRWYDVNHNIIPGQTGNLFNTIISQSTAFYVAGVTENGCEGPKASVQVTVTRSPAPTVAKNTLTACVPGLVNISVKGDYDYYKWVNGQGNAVPNQTTANLSTTIAGSTTFTVYGYRNTGCESEPVTIQVTGVQATFGCLNYVAETTLLESGITNESVVANLDYTKASNSITYFDGLGRPMQQVMKQASPNTKDVVQPVVYDDVGREYRKYLPFTAGINGFYKENIIDAQGNYTGAAKDFYGSANTGNVPYDTNPYAETRFEPSPLNRVVKQGASGTAWQPDATNSFSSEDRTVKHAYQANAVNEVLLWRCIAPSSSYPMGLVDAYSGNAPVYYAPYELNKVVSKDEEQHQVIIYTDNAGRMVLKRVQANSGVVNDENYASTYYIYNALGQLVCVLPPEAVKAITASPSEYFGKMDEDKEAFLKKWAYRYVYDDKQREVSKQIPGADPQFAIYDELDRVILQQTAEQRKINQWSFIKYDMHSRPVMTGNYNPGQNISSVEMINLVNTHSSNAGLYETYTGDANNHGYSNTVFPTGNTEVLMVMYYDNYRFKSLTNNPDYDYTESELPDQDITFCKGVTGLATGEKTKVLDETNTYLWSVRYYDNKYRNIQNTTTLPGGGYSRVTNIVDFTGKSLKTKTKHQRTGKPELITTRRFSYDHAGRLLNTWHTIGDGTEILLSANEYNELGQLVKKNLHSTRFVSPDPMIGQPGVSYNSTITSSQYNNEVAYIASKGITLAPGFSAPAGSNFKAKIGYSKQDADAYNNSTTTFAQAIDYRYNIRGWLEKINDPTVTDPSDLFSMELKYNTPTYNGGYAQFNGNISEIIWKGAGTDKQSYGYYYDAMNRMKEAKYYNSTQPSKNSIFNEKTINPSDQALNASGYDLNGNILGILRQGKRDGTDSPYGLMDNLTYTYAGNQAIRIDDAVAKHIDEEGFKENVEESNEYIYDANGNMTKDANKGITAIRYNHLNLPVVVKKNGADSIVYVYDATGKKLRQQVFGQISKRTDYVGEFLFENDVLQFINHDEGRVVMTGATPEYQYFMKDHLGNVRLTFTTKEDIESPTATMETANFVSEQSKFKYYEEAVKVNTPLFDHTNAGGTFYSTRLNGSSIEQAGLARSISVMPGDTVKTEVYAKYLDTNSFNWTTALNNLITSIASGTAPAGTFVDGGAPGSIGGIPPPPYLGLLNKDSETGTAPKASLNYLIFDRDFNFVNGGFASMTTAAREYGQDGAHEKLAAQFVITQPGYVYIFLSNDNVALGGAQIEVYFDDFSVTHVKSPVIASDDYYPFGLTFNSHQRENSVDQDFLYNGKELQRELDLGTYDYGARMYDPALGRWWQIDPLAEQMRRWSPYNYCFNNPLRFIDPDGMGPNDFVERQDGSIYWDKNANSQATTKDGEKYLGKTLTFEFNSFIDGEKWEGPMSGDFVAGNKLTSKLTVTGNENESGELTSLSATKEVTLGDTPVGAPRDHYPGLGKDQNKFSADGGQINFEQHVSVSKIEEFGLNALGYNIVNVAQKLKIGVSDNQLSVSAGTDVFPSATLTLNGKEIMRYTQPSFEGTHKASTNGVQVVGQDGATVPTYNISYRKANFYNRPLK